jgi:hypothetical protein
MPANLRLRSLQIERECCTFQMGPDRLAGFPENGRAAERDPGKRRVCSPSVQTVETMQCFEDDRRGGNRNWPSAQIREAESGVPAEFRDLNCKTTAHCRAVSDR